MENPEKFVIAELNIPLVTAAQRTESRAMADGIP